MNRTPGKPVNMTVWLLLIFFSLTSCNNTSSSRLEKQFLTPPVIKPGTLLSISGDNQSGREQTLIIRMDDTKQPEYSNRINLERVIPVGNFELKIPMHGLRTPSGRPFKPNTLQQIIVFTLHGIDGFLLRSFEFISPRQLGHKAKGWDFGAATGSIWPGFAPLTPNSSWLQGKQLKAIDRSHKKQAADSLTIDGIRGIESIHLPLKAGQWYITLWLRDSGEWEYLPHPLNQTIRAEGQVIRHRQLKAQQWIEQEYLQGTLQEPEPFDTSWELFGSRKSHRLSFPVTVDDDGLQLTFEGDQPEAGFVAALLAEPESLYPERYNVEAERAQWWQDNWPIKAWPLFNQSITDYNLHGFRLEAVSDDELLVAPGTHTSIDLMLHHRGIPTHASIQVSHPTKGTVALPTTLRWGQWQIQRSSLSSTLLEPRNSYLRHGDLPPLDGHPHPRRLNLMIQVPGHATPGLYQGDITVTVSQKKLTYPITIQVMDVQLPQPDRPIGVYLDRAVHFDWFKATNGWADQQERCDLAYLRRLGLTGIAPPLATPDSADTQVRIQQQLTYIEQLGFQPPVLAYTPVKRLLAGHSLPHTIQILGNINQQLAANNIPAPAWVTADEPSNPDSLMNIDTIHDQSSQFESSLLLAGHLNHSLDNRFTNAFDVILMNDGFGANQTKIRSLQAKNHSVWLYNLGQPGNPPSLRAAAGFFLWRSRADGFLQWHARMPTADPFDPTDGRESDIQFLYPPRTPCPAVPDIDERLFDLVEGIQDLRWLLWLEYQAQRRTDAQSLLKDLTRIIPDDWKIMKTVQEDDLIQWRQKITELALKYNDPL